MISTAVDCGVCPCRRLKNSSPSRSCSTSARQARRQKQVQHRESYDHHYGISSYIPCLRAYEALDEYHTCWHAQVISVTFHFYARFRLVKVLHLILVVHIPSIFKNWFSDPTMQRPLFYLVSCSCRSQRDNSRIMLHPELLRKISPRNPMQCSQGENFQICAGANVKGFTSGIWFRV